MLQVYGPNNTHYEKNGDMVLTPSSAAVHAELNGAWKMDLEHPIDSDGRWKYIVDGAVIKAPSFNGEQLFRIKKKKKSDSGVTAALEPIFFDAIDDCFLDDVRPVNKNGQEALNMMTEPNSKYMGRSDITRTATAYYQYKNVLEALNGDDENSFINRWGGEILFDNFTVIVEKRVGGDYGVELRYGKNIPRDGMTEEVDIREVVTRIYPKAYNGYMMTGHGYVDSPIINRYPTVKAVTMTFDDVKMREDIYGDDEENGVIACDTQEQLDAALRQRCKEQYDAGVDKPKVTICANMILLQNTEEYKAYKVLETVSLGDTIHCINEHLGVVTDARVIELEYDCLCKKVTSVVLGDYKYNYFDNVSASANRIDKIIRPDGTLMADKIAGFLDGSMTSLRAQYNVAKKQDVMAVLFENLDKESPLYGAMALGTQGLMISKTRTEDRRDWKWATALTANGLMANVIVAGILSDKEGLNYWNLDTGEFSLTSDGFTVDGKSADRYFHDTWTQKEVFDKLTSNGKAQGIYMKNGMLYINASYMEIGTIADKTGKNWWDLNTGELHAGNASFENTSGSRGATIKGGRIGIKYNGDDIGYIGGNNISGDESKKGLVFDLEDGGEYMTWAYMENASSDAYTMVMTFAKNEFSGFTSKALNMGCDIDMRNHRLLNFKTSDGYKGWTGTIPVVTKISGGDSANIAWYSSTIEVVDGIIQTAPRV